MPKPNLKRWPGYQRALEVLKSFDGDSPLVSGARVYAHVGPSNKDRGGELWQRMAWPAAPFLGQQPNFTHVLFIDDHPDAQWEHPCRYVFFNDKEFRVYSHSRPPYLGTALFSERMVEFRLEKDVAETAASVTMCPWDGLISAGGPFDSEKRALIFGGMAPEPGSETQAIAMHTILTECYGFRSSDIATHMYDGVHACNVSSPPLGCSHKPWSSINDGLPGSRETFLKTIEDIGRAASADPELRVFLFLSGHGGHDAFGSFLVCWSEHVVREPDGTVASHLPEPLYASDIEMALASMPPFHSLTVVITTCFSGGFVNAVMRGSRAQHTSITAACGERELAENSIPHWGNFAGPWLDAVSVRNSPVVKKRHSLYSVFRRACRDKASANPHDPATPVFAQHFSGTHDPCSIIYWP